MVPQGVQLAPHLLFSPVLSFLFSTLTYCSINVYVLSCSFVRNCGEVTEKWVYVTLPVRYSVSLYLPAFALFSMNISDGLRAYKCC